MTGRSEEDIETEVDELLNPKSYHMILIRRSDKKDWVRGVLEILMIGLKNLCHETTRR